MTTWMEEIGFKGYYITEAIPLYLQGDGAITDMNWQQSIPSSTNLILDSSLSLDGGITWSVWKRCFQNSSIPNISSNTPLVNAKIKFRVTITTNQEGISPELGQINLSLVPVLEFNNLGDIENSPEIWITKIGNGNFSLINTSHNNEEFKFTGLLDQETVYVDNENQNIETSLPVTYRYSNFNDNFLNIPIGISVFKVQGNAKIQFRTEFKVLS